MNRPASQGNVLWKSENVTLDLTTPIFAENWVKDNFSSSALQSLL